MQQLIPYISLLMQEKLTRLLLKRQLRKNYNCKIKKISKLKHLLIDQIKIILEKYFFSFIKIIPFRPFYLNQRFVKIL
jgi:hypothetical protein